MTSDRFKVAFQSTPSAWRETVRLSQHIKIFPVFQSTPSAWRETSDGLYFLYTNVSFQSTPSAWRETDSESTHENEEQNFNPLPPHGGRPQFYLSSFSRGEISIHSLRMEGDRWHGTNTHCWSLHFNPLPPHGGRHGNR